MRKSWILLAAAIFATTLSLAVFASEKTKEPPTTKTLRQSTSFGGHQQECLAIDVDGAGGSCQNTSTKTKYQNHKRHCNGSHKIIFGATLVGVWLLWLKGGKKPCCG